LIDISERKRLDQALHQKNGELQRATIAAENANLAKSDFLSSMSHELRSPLNAILGFAQLLELGKPPPTPLQHKNIEKILSGGWYLLALINEILDLALIESGKLALSLEPLPMTLVLQECKNMIEPQAQQKGIQIHFPISTDALLVIADPVRLRQVIVNLLSNAIKYNRIDGTVDVTVTTAGNDLVRISVQDTGEGLSPEKLSQLFQPFNRLGQERSTTQGTGIGLVVTRRLIELMGGTIGVQSTVGTGSVFWVELRAARLNQTDMDLGQACRALRATASSLGATPCTVLYVEDNQANMELVEQILMDRPHIQLLKAHSGIQGLELARQYLPSVILLDINLPDISGVEVLEILRKEPATRHIPVMAVSANAMPQDVVKGLAKGFFRYLTKPFKIDEFLKALDLAVAFASDQSVHKI
jgi:CheY-like chemotaxis protein/nitrogen-specific signal transduction histidine kinase